MGHLPNTFSGGERLRLNLAHTMVKKPRLMLLDEPTASLDNESKIPVKEMLMKLKKRGNKYDRYFSRFRIYGRTLR